MEINQLFELMERFDGSGIEELIYSKGELRIELRKPLSDMQSFGNAARLEPAQREPIAKPQKAATQAAEAPPEEVEGTFVRAPLVGTFYVSPSPGEAAFAPVGSTIKKGQTLGIIEAMKMINELPSPFDCVVEEVLALDGELVGYDAPIMRVRVL